MTKIFTPIIIALIIGSGCIDKKVPIITIVNIENSNRIELGRQLGIIKKYSPRIIALDFYLVPDSLDKDTILVKELETIDNTVQIVGLHDLYEPDYIWDSLEVSHPKFKIANHGFANLTTEDSVLIKELPMKQSFKSKQVYCFGYVVAQNAFDVKDYFKHSGDEELEFNLDAIGRNYTLLSANELYSEEFEQQYLTDKIVIMGYIGGNEDYFYLDNEKTKKVNGVEIHAAIIAELVDF